MSDKIGITLLADAALPEGHAFIEVFHDWIRRKELDELMIDVADYGHVRGGPSVYFCGHASDYAVVREVRPGLLYKRKRAPAAATTALADGLARVANVASRIAGEPRLAGTSFDRGRFIVTFFDRLSAPNTSERAAELAAETQKALEPVIGAAEIAHLRGDGRGVLELEVKPAAPLDWAKLRG